MPKCGVCGSEDCLVFYNKHVSDYFAGVKEKMTFCNRCKNIEAKREVV